MKMKRILSFTLALILIVAQLTISTNAAGAGGDVANSVVSEENDSLWYYDTHGVKTQLAGMFDIADGDIYINGSSGIFAAVQGDKSYTNLTSLTPIAITGTSTEYYVYVSTNTTPWIVLNDAYIERTGAYIHTFQIAHGSARVSLVGENELVNSGGYYAGLFVAPDASVTIDGGGSLYAQGIMAPGIGGGYVDSKGGGTITINDGNISAVSSGGEACIGGSSAHITINDGTVTAIARGSSAGIGGGVYDVTINGGTVVAHGRVSSPGIGTKTENGSGTVNITGGNVIVRGGINCSADEGGPGIGATGNGGGTISISGAETLVDARGGSQGRDISVSSGEALTIRDGATVFLRSGGLNSDILANFTDCKIYGVGAREFFGEYNSSGEKTVHNTDASINRFDIGDYDVVIVPDSEPDKIRVSRDNPYGFITVPYNEETGITVCGESDSNGILLQSGFEDFNLKLDQVDVRVAGGTAIALYIERDTSASVELIGESYLKCVEGAPAVAVETNSALHLFGSGLTAETGNDSCGMLGAITLDVEDLTSFGEIYGAPVIINRGNVTAYGLSAISGQIYINGGNVTAIGIDRDYCGPGMNGDIEITGGTVLAKGGSTTVNHSTAGSGIMILPGRSLTVTGGNVTAIGGTGFDSGSDWPVFDGAGVFCQGSVNVSGEETIVSATGAGKAEDISSVDMYNSFPFGTITVSDGATVYATNNGFNIGTMNFTSCVIDGDGAGEFEGTYDENGFFTIDVTNITASPSDGASTADDVVLTATILASRKTGVVNPTPTGNIVFKYGDTEIASVPITQTEGSAGTASTTWSGSAVGSYALSATYVSETDDKYAAGNSGELEDYPIVEALSGTVSISGTPHTGETLTANKSLNATEQLSYQWKRDGVSIDGETKGTYVIRKSDVGKEITVTVTATGNYRGSVTSEAVTVIRNKEQVSINEAVQTVKYDGRARGFVVNGSPNSGYTITYSTADPTAVGSYDVTISRAADDAYEAFSTTITGGLVIRKRTLTSADILVEAPATGTVPANTASVADSVYTVTGVSWSGAPGVFAASTQYSVVLTVEPDGNHEFSSGTKMRVNGQPAVAVLNLDGSMTVSCQFPATTEKTITGIGIEAQPSTLTYLSGDKLSLDGLVVTVTYSDLSTESLPFAQLSGAVYTINGAVVGDNTATLTNSAHNGKGVTVLYGGQTATTAALTVNKLRVTLASAIGTAVGDAISTSLNNEPYDAGESITINYVLDSPALLNELRFDKNLPTVRVAGSDSVNYRVSRGDSDAGGLITITPTFVHDSTIYSANVKIAPPVKGATPQATIDSGNYYTAAIAWSPIDGSFAAETVYTAAISLTANGVGAKFADSFALTVNGKSAVKTSVSGTTAEFSFTFSETANKEVVAIEVTTPPKLRYTVGEKLDLSELELTVSYDSSAPSILGFTALANAIFEIEDASTVNGASLYSANDGEVLTVSYGGKKIAIGILDVYTQPNLSIKVTDLTANTATIEYYTNKGTAVLLDKDGSPVSGPGALSASVNLVGLEPATAYTYTLRVNDNGADYDKSISFITLASTGTTINGSITDSSKPQSIVVTIELGNTVVAAFTANRDNDYAFEFVFDNIESGVYNIVADNGSYKVTRAIEIGNGINPEVNINMDTGKTQSIVEIKSATTPPAAVDGLPELFVNSEIYKPEDAAIVNSNGVVELKLVAEQVDSPEDADNIRSSAQGQDVGMFIDLSVYKSHFKSSGELTHSELVKDLGQLSILTITFELPVSLKGKALTAIYRSHDGEVNILSGEPNANGEYFVQNGDLITIFANKFSTYALAVEKSNVPSLPGTDIETPWENPYSDVKEDDWFYDEVQYVTENELMNGVGGSLFDPYGGTSRAMITTILWRIAGEPKTGKHNFVDVPDGQWYSQAIKWAAENGIVKGYGEGIFAPDRTVSREEMTAIIYRYIQFTGKGFTGEWMFLLDFVDRDKIADWSYEAVCYCTMQGIVEGRPGGVFDPQGTATRAEIAAVIMRFCGK